MGPGGACRHGSAVPFQCLLPALLCLLYVSSADSLYHTSSETLHWFSQSAAKHSSLMRFRELRQRHTHMFIPIATVTAGADVVPPKHNKPVVLLVFGEHARELITSEVAIWLTRLLIDNSSAIYTWPELGQAMQRAQDSSSSSSSDLDHWSDQMKGIVSNVLVKLEIQIIPIEALDSRRQVEQGELCVRKTSSNVDLNRNWPFAWRRESPSDEQYGGPGPLSEPHSRLVKQLIDSHDGRLLGYVNVHSGEWALYTPWDSKPAYAPDLPVDLPQLVAQIGRLCECKAGPAGAVSGYLAFGSSMDYVYVNKKVPYPLTVEVYGGGDIGKLQSGETNKPLMDFPIMEKPAAGSAAGSAAADIPPSKDSRGLLQQQQQQWDRPAQQQQQQQRVETAAQQQQQQCLMEWQQGWSQRIWWLWSCIQQQLRPRQQQQHQQEGVVSMGYSSIPAGAGRTAAAADPQGLDSKQQLRRMSLLQLTEQQFKQQQQGVAAVAKAGVGFSHSKQQQQQRKDGSAARDGILDTVASASAGNQACFNAFNPQTVDVYRRVVADWVVAFVLMLQHMADSEAYKGMTAAAGGGAGGNSSLTG